MTLEERKLHRAEDNIRITTPILSKVGNTVIGLATGFFYAYKYLVLVTNRHVVINEKTEQYPSELVVRLHTDLDGNDLTQNQFYTIPLYDENNTPQWIEHPEYGSDADVVCVLINQDHPMLTETTGMMTSPDMQLPEFIHPSWISHVSIVGYPKGYYDQVHNLPIVKSGCVASPYGIYHNGKPNFLVDAAAEPGMSGSPVFTHRISDYLNTEERMAKLPSPGVFFLGVLSGGINNVLNLNTIWYASLIKEILDPLPSPS
ncbi:MAG: trypsin-like peptidase domain-containing protein [bacterium]|nr:trypsin-like peptidase domain-containing protein [bacterium]